MSIKHSLAKTLAEQRKRQQLSQDKVAASADLSNRFYRSIESGDKLASISSLFKIAKSLDIHYSELLDPAWEYWLEHPEELEDQ